VQGVNREEVLFVYGTQFEEFYIDFHKAQPNKAGTPMLLPEVPIGAIVRIEFLIRANVAGLTSNTQVFSSASNGTNKVFLTPISNTLNLNISATNYGAQKAVLRWQNTTGVAIPTSQRMSMYIRQNGTTVPISCAVKDFVAYIE
jgi:hypothetical protein